MILEEGGVIVDVKLLDFGIAKLIDNAAGHESKTGVAMGTPQFMAPEQAKDSKNVDARADVYSFGATVFTALCGRPPFVASNITDLILQIHTQEAPRLRGLAGGIPLELDDVIANCLSKNIDERPASIAQAWQRILDSLATAPMSATPLALAQTAQSLAPEASEGEAISRVPQTGASSSAAAAIGAEAARFDETNLSLAPRRAGRLWLVGAVVSLAGIAGALMLGRGEGASSTSDAGTQTATTSIDGAPPELADATPEVKRSTDPKCSIYDYLQLDNGITTVAAAEAKLLDFERCLADGEISPGQFVGLRESLVKQIGAFTREARTAKAIIKPVPYKIEVRNNGAETITGTLLVSPKTGRLSGNTKILDELKRLAEDRRDFHFEVHSDSDGSPDESYARSKRIAAAITRKLSRIGIPKARFSGRAIAGPPNQVVGPENRRVLFLIRPKSGVQ